MGGLALSREWIGWGIVRFFVLKEILQSDWVACGPMYSKSTGSWSPCSLLPGWRLKACLQ